VPPSPSATLEPTAAPVVLRPQYTIFVTFDYAGRGLTVDETIRYANAAGEALNTLVLAVSPNRWGDCFQLRSIKVDGERPDFSLNSQRLEIRLARPLEPGAALTVEISYELDLPRKSYDGIFGHSGGYIHLVDWYPFVVPYRPGYGWVLHEPWSVGEHYVYPLADFDVRLRMSPGQAAPVIAASAPGVADGEWTRYLLPGARTFSLDAGDYSVLSGSFGSVPVTVYVFPGHETAGWAALGAVKDALQTYSLRFAPYPYPSFSLVEVDYPDGMEYDGLVYLGDGFFSEYDGDVQSNLVPIAVHETAHQWWFGLVASDQAAEPWLDEALATYSERLFFEDRYPYLVDWWWQFRVNYFTPAGWVDTTVYNGGSFRSYTNAVYLRGALFLEDLRLRVGEFAYYDFLQDYARQGTGRIVTADDFFAILRTHSDADISDLLRIYFLNHH